MYYRLNITHILNFYETISRITNDFCIVYCVYIDFNKSKINRLNFNLDIYITIKKKKKPSAYLKKKRNDRSNIILCILTY